MSAALQIASADIARLDAGSALRHPEPGTPEWDELLLALTHRFAATAAVHDRDASFPHANFAALHEHGLLSLTVPRSQGGAEATLAQAASVIHAVARGEPSTALVLVMQYLFQVMIGRSTAWPAHLRERVAHDAVQSGALINALRVEPELGTPARGGLPATVARRVPEGWRISGRKLYSTGIPRLTWLAVWSRSDDADPLVGSWLVHRDTPGISVIENWDHLGMRASGSHEVVFDDVLVPADHAVDVQLASAPPRADGGFFSWTSVLLSALYDGVAHAARDWFVQWAHSRVPANLGAPLSSVPRFQEALGEIDALLFASKTILHAATQGQTAPTDQGFIKYIVTGNAIAAVQKIAEISGNPALSRHNPLERHLRDVLCSRIHTPQNDAILTAAGKSGFARHAASTLAPF
ncbi:putative acyl-CoA dehydrogenase YdbM [Andreprevotia sp. IGB-42]|uniref:acyl-CoA dehydrogenase family protein n=1 Tax=Andreprevotia sp. IGB-42 TaxID=2497473 RepID=UPI0013595838|nr:acyl-CoA dehydrogenase family protein [Andreprevotia sp. IGB-42]KAF0812640.1 putative acyl-CoA dehydrogenase YdbM [Andreprevotia sp. IGB-42]